MQSSVDEIVPMQLRGIYLVEALFYIFRHLKLGLQEWVLECVIISDDGGSLSCLGVIRHGQSIASSSSLPTTTHQSLLQNQKQLQKHPDETVGMGWKKLKCISMEWITLITVSYTHLRAHETKANLVCRLLLEAVEYLSLIHIWRCRRRG